MSEWVKASSGFTYLRIHSFTHSLIHSFTFHLVTDRLKIGRHYDFDQLQIIRMRQFDMPDPRRLVHAGAGLERDLSNAFVAELHPALEHIHQLKLNFVMMPFRLRMRPRLGTDDVGKHQAIGGVAYAEIAVLEERPQAVVLEFAGLEMTH